MNWAVEGYGYLELAEIHCFRIAVDSFGRLGIRKNILFWMNVTLIGLPEPTELLIVLEQMGLEYLLNVAKDLLNEGKTGF